MLSRPFRGMTRGRLLLILLMLVLLEVAGGAGLVVNNRQSGTPSAVPTAQKPATRTRTALASIRNYPRTVVVGKTETFSVRLPDLASKQVTYEVAYPDGSSDKVTVQTDASGFSQHTFVVAYKPTDRREAIGIGVYYQGQQRAYTQFAVQLPTRTIRP